jgi:agmatinase
MAPATGTPEPGGYTTREVKKILRGLSGLNLVGLDVVEVSPAYDTNAELTGMVAADLVQEFLNLMIKKGDRVPAVANMKLNLGQGEAVDGSEAAHDEL